MLKHFLVFITAFWVMTALPIGSMVPVSPGLPFELTYQSKSAISGIYTIYHIEQSTLEAKPFISLETNKQALDGFVWASDGTRLAVIIRDRTSVASDQICVYSAEGKLDQCFAVKLYGDSTINFPVTWGNNNQDIQFLGTCSGSAACLGSIKLLNANIQYDSLPSILSSKPISRLYRSPKNKFVAYFASEDISSGKGILYIFNSGDNEEILIKTMPFGAEDCLSWSNDETKLALVKDRTLTISPAEGLALLQTRNLILGGFSGTSPAGATGIQATEKPMTVDFLGTLDASDLLSPTTGQNVIKTYSGVGCPLAWSHSGSYIAYSTVDDSGSSNIVTLDTKQGSIVKLLNNFYPVYHIVWSPDDSALAFDTVSTGEVVIVMNGWEKWFRLYDTPLGNPSWRP